MGDGFIRHKVNVFGEDMLVIRPVGPFDVDGITYRLSLVQDSSVGCVRPMISLVADNDDPYDDDGERAEMFHSEPPTEDQLDMYVYQNILPPT